MKTWLKIAAAAALACTVPAGAQATTFATTGEMRVRGWSLENYQQSGESGEFWDQRLRLNLDWSVSDLVTIHARADILEGVWGDEISKPAIAFDHANVQFVLPGAPLKLLVGRQDVSWGTGYWVQEDNRDRLALGLKFDPVGVLIAYDQFTETDGLGAGREDAWALGVGAIADAAGFKFGLLVVYMQDGSRTRFPAGDLTYWVGGLFASGSLGPVSAKAEVVSGAGTIDRPGVGDLDVRGVGAYAAASLPVGPVIFSLEGAYAGGDDPKTSGRNEGFFSADYQGPFSSLIFYNTMDIAGYAGDTQSSSPEADFSVRNARAAKISATVSPLQRLAVTGAALYASADRTRDGVAREMGWEFDVVAVYGIAERVSLSAGVGYAVLGDYWASAPIAGGGGGKPENPLGCMVAVTSNF